MRYRVSKSGKESETAPVPTVSSPTRRKTTQQSHICREPSQFHVGSLIVGSVSVSSWVLARWVCGFSSKALDSSVSYFFSSSCFSSAVFPKLGLFGCGSLHLFPPMAAEVKWGLFSYSPNLWAYQNVIRHYFIDILFSSMHIWFYHRSQGNSSTLGSVRDVPILGA